MKEFARQYERTLRENVIPFWERYSIDPQFGGYFNCLDRDGTVFDTEKFMWLQWRNVWMFSELYSTFEQRDDWLHIAQGGYDFLIAHGKDAQGRYYFSLARDGTPATAPYSIFSDCFATMGAAAYYRATQDQRAREEALHSFAVYQSRKNFPKQQWEKSLPGRNAMQTLGYYMMEINLSVVLEDCLGDTSYRSLMRQSIDFVFNTFWNEKMGILFENRPVEGEFDLASMAGRHLNPGHAIEAMWMIMLAAERVGHPAAVQKAADVLIKMLDYGWDKEFGGIFYFMDAMGRPHLELQWDMKLWWVHCEALIATAMAFRLTRRSEFRGWFEKIHEWTWSHFPDSQYGEWFGYLNRRGEVTHTLKGGKWKTFFHLPRALLLCSKYLADTAVE